MGKIKCRAWQPKEDERLLRIINKFRIGDHVPWGIVARYMHNRTKQQIYFRWIYSLAPHIKKGRFTKEEDKILINAVKQYGENFCRISAMLMPHRSSIQLHDHYRTLNLRKIGRGNIWTITDDIKIIENFDSIGPNWSVIAKQFVDKSRTQVRHRYKALRKYAKKGISVLQIPRPYHIDYEKEEVAIKKLLPGKNRKDSRSIDIDWQLIDHFNFVPHSSKSGRKNLYTHNELTDTVKKLYNMLNMLHAKLNIPIDCDISYLDKRDNQLLDAMKCYMETQNNPHTKNDIIEAFRTKMFGARSKLESMPHFTPPPPSLSHMRKTSKRKSKNMNHIDYDLDLQKKFVFDVQWEFELPESVCLLIGGEEQEMQFQKICRLIQFGDQTFTKSNVQQKIYVLTPDLLSRNIHAGKCGHNTKSQTSSASMSVTFMANRNILYEERDTYCAESITGLVSSNTQMEERSNFVISSYSYHNKKESINILSTIIEPGYTTLLSFKQLSCLKHLYDADNSHSDTIDIEESDSAAFQKAYQLLRTRLLQLFKYPIGLSKISLPEIYQPDIFLHNSPEKRKAQRDTLTRNKKIKLTIE
ncbi:hypothetical protein KM043_003018 [Ampulex compressa]|nr:hypothetical protein KM043_003018 [Ampulex compressa]